MNGALDAGLPVARIRLDSAGASVVAQLAGLLAAELGLCRPGAALWLLAGEERIEDELARREVVLVVHRAARMLAEALYWLCRVWNRTSPGTRAHGRLHGEPGLRPGPCPAALADLKSCIFIHIASTRDAT